jgi:hypothetical protein
LDESNESLIADTKEIASNADVKSKEHFFKTVSTNMYDLMKVSKSETHLLPILPYGKGELLVKKQQ